MPKFFCCTQKYFAHCLVISHIKGNRKGIKDMENMTKTKKEGTPKKKSGFYMAFPLIAIGYVMLCSSIMTKQGLLNKTQTSESETETVTFENVKTPFDRFAGEKAVDGKAPEIIEINYERNEDNVITAAEIIVDKPVTAFVETVPSYVGKYEGDGLIQIAKNSTQIKFSNEDLKEKVKSDLTGILEGVFPVQIYAYSEDGNSVSEPLRLSVFNDKHENLIELKQFTEASGMD